MSDLMKNWNKAKKAVSNAKDWNELPNGQRYQDDKFRITVPHCTNPIFKRMGQKSCGGNSYWETDKEFGSALMDYLMLDWKTHFSGALKILEEKEKTELLNLQTFVDALQAKITEVEK